MDQGRQGAIKWTRLSCRTFTANAVRLQLHAARRNNFLEIVSERNARCVSAYALLGLRRGQMNTFRLSKI